VGREFSESNHGCLTCGEPNRALAWMGLLKTQLEDSVRCLDELGGGSEMPGTAFL